MILILIIFLNIILIALLCHFEPSIQKISTGEFVLWYNSDRHRKIRKYVKLNKR